MRALWQPKRNEMDGKCERDNIFMRERFYCDSIHLGKKCIFCILNEQNKIKMKQSERSKRTNERASEQTNERTNNEWIFRCELWIRATCTRTKIYFWDWNLWLCTYALRSIHLHFPVYESGSKCNISACCNGDHVWKKSNAKTARSVKRMH